MGIEFPRDDVKNIFFLEYTISGEAFEIKGKLWPVVPEAYELAKKFASLVEKLLEQGLVKNHPVCMRDGGLDGILGRMQELKEGKVSAVKMVYRIGQE
jgi:hypothetical protein